MIGKASHSAKNSEVLCKGSSGNHCKPTVLWVKPSLEEGSVLSKTNRRDWINLSQRLHHSIHSGLLRKLAEGVGFEPTVPFSTSVFKTDAIDHSTTPPGSSLYAGWPSIAHSLGSVATCQYFDKFYPCSMTIRAKCESVVCCFEASLHRSILLSQLLMVCISSRSVTFPRPAPPVA